MHTDGALDQPSDDTLLYPEYVSRFRKPLHHACRDPPGVAELSKCIGAINPPHASQYGEITE